MVRVRVPAKINLALCVGPLGEDGFHPVNTVYQAVNLYDELLLWPSGERTLVVSGESAEEVPTGPENLALRAVDLLAENFTVPSTGVYLDLRKAIPVAGGMAGGSADAAAALLAVNEWAGLGLDLADLSEFAAELGSDVPFALVGGVALGSGRGDQLVPMMHRGHQHWVLAVAAGGLATASVYARFDELFPQGQDLAVPEELMSAMASGDLDQLAASLRNDLAAAALDLRPDLADVLAAGERAGALAGMVSGSGPTCAFLCRDENDAINVSTALGAEAGIAKVKRVRGPVPGARVVRELADGDGPLCSPHGG